MNAVEFENPMLQNDQAAGVAPHAELELELERIRLLLERRIAWLRSRWQDDPLQSYGSAVISDRAADALLEPFCAENEARFMESDKRALKTGKALAEIEAKRAAQRQAMREQGGIFPLDALAELFVLSKFERDVIALCLAPELDARFETLFAYVQDDVACKYPTPHLALALFGEGDRSLLRASFAPDAPLRRCQLVVLDALPSARASVSARALRLDDRIAAYLLGTNRLDERLTDLLRPLPVTPVAPAQNALAERLARLVTSSERGGAINLVGPHGAGLRAVASAVGTHLGIHTVELDLMRLPQTNTERRETLRLLEREAVLLNLGYFVDASAVDRHERATVVGLSDVAIRLGALRIIASHERLSSLGEMLVVRLERPDAQARHALWQECLAVGPPAAHTEIDALVQQFDLEPEEIQRCVHSAFARAKLEGDADCATPDASNLWRAAREEAARPLDELAQRIVPVHGWDDIVLPADVLGQLREIAAQVANRTSVYEEWGFDAKLSRGRGISALFAGPSGTGKTMAAEVIAKHLDLDLFRIDLAGVVSKYIGETEKNLKRMFDAAEACGAILFFDEADALFGKRTEVKDSHDRYANIEINYLLQRMEDYRGLAILATNMKSQLDHAFLRRLRFIVDLPFPDVELRRRIWQRVFPAAAPIEGLDYEALARLDVAGGNVKNIAVNAAFAASASGSPICMEHVLAAAKREYEKLDKLMVGTDLGPSQARGRR